MSSSLTILMPVYNERSTVERAIDDALSAGFDQAAKDTAGSGFTGAALAYALRKLVAPTIAWFIGQDSSLGAN